MPNRFYVQSGNGGKACLSTYRKHSSKREKGLVYVACFSKHVCFVTNRKLNDNRIFFQVIGPMKIASFLTTQLQKTSLVSKSARQQ